MAADEPPGGQGPPPALVRVAEVQQQRLEARWEVVGRLREVRRTIVSVEQPGRVVEAPFGEGQVVAAGQTVLLRVDDVWACLSLEQAQAQLAQAQAAVAHATARRDQAKRDRQYLEDLQRSGSAQPKEVADAVTTEQAEQANLDGAVAGAQAAQVQVRSRREELARLTITSPFDGYVTQKLTEVGVWVDQGDQVAEIITKDRIDALIDVPEHLINHLRLGQSIELWIEPLDLEATGTVREIIPSAPTAARTFPVKVVLDDHDGQLKPGMSVTARVPTSEQVEVLTVPRDAVLRSDRGATVWVDSDGAALPVGVKVLFGQDDRYAVESVVQVEGAGLSPAMRVVIEGAERLFPGQPLMIAAGSSAVQE